MCGHPLLREYFTLLRRKPRLRAVAHFGAQARFFRPWMNAMRVPYEALEERSGVCFGGFRLPARSRFGEGRPDEACGGATGFSPWGLHSSTTRPMLPNSRFHGASLRLEAESPGDAVIQGLLSLLGLSSSLSYQNKKTHPSKG
jgi:hypothetical protein